MKRLKKNWGKLLLAGAFLLVVFSLWFARPMTLGSMFSDFDPTGVSQMGGYYSRHLITDGHVGFDTWKLESTSLDEEGRALLQTLNEAKFRRDIPDNLYMLFHNSWSSKRNAASDYSLIMSFYGGGGDMLHLDLNIGWLSFTHYPAGYPNRPKQTWYCSLAGHEELLDSLCVYFKTHGVPQQ